MRLSINQPAASQTSPDFSSLQQNQKPTDNRIIARRNIFNSSPAKKEAHSPAVRQTTSVKQSIQKAPNNLILLGTVVASDESLAVISVNNVIEVIRLKQNISGSGTLATVRRNQVEIRTPNGSLLLLEMEYSARNRANKTSGTIFGIPKQTQTSMVRNLGNNRWVIPTNEADNIRTNIASIIKQVRIDPHVVNGKTDGFVVKRIRRNTLLDQMGIKRGDVLHAVNGVTLNSPEKGLQVFQQLREARTLNLDLKRAGKSMNFQYEIK